MVLPERVQASQVEDLLAQFLKVGANDPLEVDVSAVTKIDTAGVQLLASVLKRQGGRLCGRSAAVEQAAALLGLSSLFSGSSEGS